MDKYIYFAAEMPSLLWGTEQFLSEEDFLEEAGKWMNEADYKALSDTLADKYESAEPKGVYSEYLSFEKISELN